MSALEFFTKSMELCRYHGGIGGVGYVTTIAFWAWEAVVQVGRVFDDDEDGFILSL
jgi:hypothetical protein